MKEITVERNRESEYSTFGDHIMNGHWSYKKSPTKSVPRLAGAGSGKHYVLANDCFPLLSRARRLQLLACDLSILNSCFRFPYDE